MSHTESDLIEAARELRELVDADAYPQLTLDKQRVRRLRDLLHTAAGVVASMAERAREREGRISRLESSNGHLMVEADRARSKAAEGQAAARELLIQHVGLDAPEVDRQMREQAEYSRRTFEVLDRERTAYDQFRVSVVMAMHELRDVEQLSAEQWAALRKIVARQNKRALGR
jgi:hypothetical protein